MTWTFKPVTNLSVGASSDGDPEVTFTPPAGTFPEPVAYFDTVVCKGTSLGPVLSGYPDYTASAGLASYTVWLPYLLPQTTYIVAVRVQGAGHGNSSAWTTQVFTTPPVLGPLPYVNPLAQVSGLVCERVDQGVDFAGTGGPILALGDGVIIETNGTGWPGGPYMAYRLSNGPAAGKVVYVAEDLTVFQAANLSAEGRASLQSMSVTNKAAVSQMSLQQHTVLAAGATVKAGQQIATLYNGPDGIEMGWGRTTDGLVPESQQPECGSISGANLPAGGGGTLIGRNFDELLRRLGVPAANNLNQAPGGTLPAGWPTWF